MQLVAINVSMAFRIVMPCDRKVLKFLAAWIAISGLTAHRIHRWLISSVLSAQPRSWRILFAQTT